VIGSQAILGAFDDDELPDLVKLSREADYAFLDDPAREKGVSSLSRRCHNTRETRRDRLEQRGTVLAAQRDSRDSLTCLNTPSSGLGVQWSQVQILSARQCDVAGHRRLPDLREVGSAVSFWGFAGWAFGRSGGLVDAGSGVGSADADVV